jgi:transposase InsO family protein
VSPAPLLDQLPVAVVQKEEALQFGSRRRSSKPPVGDYLLVGEEFNRHAPDNEPALPSVTRWSSLALISAPILLTAQFAQYTSARFRQLLAAHGIRQSLSRPRQVWDNAVVEAFYSTLKVELVHRCVWATRPQARQAIFDFIEVFYNRQRLHSTLDYQRRTPHEIFKIAIDRVSSSDGWGR